MSAGSVSAWRGPTIFCRAARTASRFIAPNLEEPPRARFPPRRAAKDGGDFDMRGKAELVKRRHGLDQKAALDENARVAGECRRVARDGCDERQRGGGELARLLERARARRIDERGVECGELVGSERAAEEIAGLGDELA